MKMSEILCIYHKNCTDGFGAAWVIHSLYPSAQFVPAHYGDAPPDVTGKHVLIVDFSYPRPVLLEMAKTAIRITVIDHHKTARAELVDLPDNVVVKFDMSHSGAVLTWMAHFSAAPPRLLLAIEDRDLWRWKLPDTRTILAALNSYPQDFEVWDRLMEMDTNEFLAEGRAIERKYQQDLKALTATPWRRVQIGGHSVPVANLNGMFISDACNVKAQGEPFAAAYFDTADRRVFSLRSAEDGLDVSAIAAAYGGGGHVHAAGFTVAIGWDGDPVPAGGVMLP
jgi:oligoribonuclease NrnB/cAMP/cGMP phosphodiesterase (DHH superfamily)